MCNICAHFFVSVDFVEILMVYRLCITNPFSLFEFWFIGWCDLPIVVHATLYFPSTIPDPFPGQKPKYIKLWVSFSWNWRIGIVFSSWLTLKIEIPSHKLPLKWLEEKKNIFGRSLVIQFSQGRVISVSGCFGCLQHCNILSYFWRRYFTWIMIPWNKFWCCWKSTYTHYEFDNMSNQSR